MAAAPLFGGIEAGGTKFVLGVGHGPDSILARTVIPTTTPDETLARCIVWFDSKPSIAALGIASFGPLILDAARPDHGSIGATPKPGWSGTGLLSRLSEALGVPAAIDTDVNGAAVAEHRWGAARDCSVAAYVTIGTGLGGGIIVDGRAIHGNSHPEIGHFLLARHPADRDFAGVCPFHGDCAEGLISGPAIIARWGASLSDLEPGHPGHAIIADYVGQLCVTLQAMVAPQRIILGGGVSKAPGLIDAAGSAANAQAAGYFPVDFTDIVTAPGLGDNSGLLGAFARQPGVGEQHMSIGAPAVDAVDRQDVSGVWKNVSKPRLSLANVAQMNLGFLGLQFSFGLQQSNMGPIYNYLGAVEASLPLLFLAGPVTGLLVQPIVGAMSDRTLSRFGRRTPYFLIGAIICSLCLLAMPYSSTLWMAVGLLWILDAANNITMEPYRAYVGDRLSAEQQPSGFLMQASFTGLAQTLAYLAPTLFVLAGFDKDAVDANGIPHVTRLAFIIGAILSFATIAWSVWRVRELPLTPAQVADIRSKPLTAGATLVEIVEAIRDMPATMRQLGWMMLFQWYGMFCYWQFVVNALALSIFDTGDAASQGYRDAALLNGQVGGFYNFIAFLAGFALMPLVRRTGAKSVHAVAIGLSGAGMLAIPQIADPLWLLAPMIGIGIGWASIMGTPYVILARSIPPERTGVYMGIFNMMIVIPMLIQTLTLPLFYESLLGGDPRNVILLGGGCLIVAALLCLRVREMR